MPRTIYRSLDEKFLNIVKDSKTVDKISEVIKANQANLTPENVDSAMVSQTTKQVVLKTLTPDNCDIMQVVLDFMDELQTAILQVRLNLSREYERRKLEWAKSKEGQQQDIDNLNKTLTEQGQGTVDALGNLADEDEQWKLERLSQIESMLKTLDLSGDVEQGISSSIDQLNKAIQQGQKVKLQDNKPPKQIDLRKLVSEIEGSNQIGGIDQTQPEVVEQDGKQWRELEKEQKQYEKEIQNDISLFAKESKGLEKTKIPEVDQKQSKIDVSPTKKASNGLCTCPICGHVHQLGQPHGPTEDTQLPSAIREPGAEGGSITRAGVVSTLGKIHNNLQKTLQNKKFVNAFSPNYNAIQKGLGQQMKKIDKGESEIAKNLKKTQRQIFMLKAKAKANALLGMFFGGIGKFMVFALGALILIGLTRFALNKWS